MPNLGFLNVGVSMIYDDFFCYFNVKKIMIFNNFLPFNGLQKILKKSGEKIGNPKDFLKIAKIVIFSRFMLL